MVELQDLKKATHENTLRSRSIEAIVHSAKFERLWQSSTDTQKQEAEFAVWQASKPQLTGWMKAHGSLELGEQPLSYLRNRAKALRIKYYSRLSKPELIGEIEKKEKIDE